MARDKKIVDKWCDEVTEKGLMGEPSVTTQAIYFYLAKSFFVASFILKC
jgi:hypothetical protein